MSEWRRLSDDFLSDLSMPSIQWKGWEEDFKCIGSSPAIFTTQGTLQQCNSITFPFPYCIGNNHGGNEFANLSKNAKMLVHGNLVVFISLSLV